MNYRAIVGITCLAVLLSACGNPGGISDSDYAAYKELAAPKLLYSCAPKDSDLESRASFQCGGDRKSSCYKDYIAANGEGAVSYAAGVGAAVTYNKLLADAKAGCSGNFKVLDSKS